jgi:hypothetical protein
VEHTAVMPELVSALPGRVALTGRADAEGRGRNEQVLTANSRNGKSVHAEIRSFEGAPR